MRLHIYSFTFVVVLYLTSQIAHSQDHMKELTFEAEDSNQISYRQGGDGEETLVFIHAGGLDKNMWAKEMNYFSEFYRVLSYDVRGQGKSISQNEDIKEIDDLYHLLEEENIDHFHLIGLSFGAILALDYVLQYPEQVDNLVLASPGLIGLQEKHSLYLEKIQKYMAALQKGDQPEIIWQLKILSTGRTTNLPSEIDQYVRQCLGKYVEKNGHLRLPQIQETAPLDHLSEIQSPTLILYGAEDLSFIQENAQRLDKEIEDSQLEKIAGAAHLINLEKPGIFQEILSKFLGTEMEVEE
ncbi:MAG: alpha/beta hydrolase [Bacteroidota bacterium]